MKTLKLMPGILTSVIIAFVAVWLESLLPIHVIGSAVIAMFIGMIINHFLDLYFMMEVLTAMMVELQSNILNL